MGARGRFPEVIIYFCGHHFWREIILCASFRPFGVARLRGSCWRVSESLCRAATASSRCCCCWQLSALFSCHTASPADELGDLFAVGVIDDGGTAVGGDLLTAAASSGAADVDYFGGMATTMSANSAFGDLVRPPPLPTYPSRHAIVCVSHAHVCANCREVEHGMRHTRGLHRSQSALASVI